MKTVTYHGPSDRRRVDGRYLDRGVPTELPDHLADKLARSPNVTVEDGDDTDAAAGGEGEVNDGS